MTKYYTDGEQVWKIDGDIDKWLEEYYGEDNVPEEWNNPWREIELKPCMKCGHKASYEEDGCYGYPVCFECGFMIDEGFDNAKEKFDWWNDQPLVDRLRAKGQAIADILEYLIEYEVAIELWNATGTAEKDLEEWNDECN